MTAVDPPGGMDITELLTAAIQARVSDPHLRSSNWPIMRQLGEPCPMVENRRLDAAKLDAMAAERLPSALQPRVTREHDEMAHASGTGRNEPPFVTSFRD